MSHFEVYDANYVEDDVSAPNFDAEIEALFAREAAKSPEKVPETMYNRRELIVDGNGVARQAGSDVQEGQYIREIRKIAEESLYFFGKVLMQRDYFVDHLHLPVCDFVQQCPPHRKLVLMPREHAKTSIVAHCLPPHILIQKAESNIYFPGLEGCECRILLAGETELMAKKNMRVVQAAFTGNQLLRALWPERVWESNPRKHGARWNDTQMDIPRETDWPDPSIRAVGVGGAVTGSRPNVLIKDDLISVAAANSDIEMLNAIEWHKVSRALLEEYEHDTGLVSLEFIVGTRWAVHDLYSYVIANDDTVEQIDKKFHQIVRDGVILWPERINEKFIEQKIKEYGSMYYLLYLNSAADPSLTDFDCRQLRTFEIKDGHVEFAETHDDEILAKGPEIVEAPKPIGVPFNSATYDMFAGKGRDEYFRFKYT